MAFTSVWRNIFKAAYFIDDTSLIACGGLRRNYSYLDYLALTFFKATSKASMLLLGGLNSCSRNEASSTQLPC